MVHLLMACCIALGLLGLTMTCFSLYVVRVNSRLETTVKEKDTIILKKEEIVEERTKALKEKEGYVVLLKEQINVRDRTINRLKRKGSNYLNPIDIE